MSCQGCFSTAFPGCGWYNPARKRKSGRTESCIHINHNLCYTGKGMGVHRAQTPQNRPIEKTGGTEHETQIPYTHQLFIDRQPVHRAAQRHRPCRRPGRHGSPGRGREPRPQLRRVDRHRGRPDRDREDHEYRDQIRHPPPPARPRRPRRRRRSGKGRPRKTEQQRR